MKKSSPNKKKPPVRKRKATPFTLDPETLNQLRKESEETGVPMSRILDRRVLRVSEFSQSVEDWISRSAHQKGISRSQVLERALIAAMGKQGLDLE